MASWQRVSTKRTGVQLLPYYHMSGCDGFAKEFIDLCFSVSYAQHTNDFLFIFDMINPIGTEYFYFQNVLKKSQFLRYLPYYPSSGFNVRSRHDLFQPIVDRGKIADKPYVYDFAQLLFDFQPKVREYIGNFFAKHEITGQSGYQIGIVYDSAFPDPSFYLEKLHDFPREKQVTVYLQCPSLEVYKKFQSIVSRNWTLKSIQTSEELHTQTMEQRIKRYYLEIAELQILRSCPILVGTFQNPVCTLCAFLERHFREIPSTFRSLDGKPFRIL